MREFDGRVCTLGEGALWHPVRRELFWFDIVGKRMYSRNPATGVVRDVACNEMCSAAGWIDEKRLLVASETGLWLFDVEGTALTRLVKLEADNPQTRSNDGRVDPWGGFWIGTMGKEEEEGAGALYRYYRGELRELYANLTIPNTTCFAPNRTVAYFSDTQCAHLYKVALDSEGWPTGVPELFVDFSVHGLYPDGGVTLPDGSLRVALWGEGAVVEVTPEGLLGKRMPVGAPHATCPAFGGEEFSTLFCTSATKGLSVEARQAAPLSGKTFMLQGAGPGKPEPAFDLSGIDLTGEPE